MYDAGDRKSVRKAQKAAALADRNRGEVLIQLVSSEAGRRFLWEHLSTLHLFESLYNDSSHRMAFLEGRRSAGLALLSDWMQWAPDQFILAMREANGRRTANDAANQPRTNGAAGQRPDGEEPGREPEGYAGSDADSFPSGGATEA